MSTAEDDDEKTVAGPPQRGPARPGATPPSVAVESGLAADRGRARAPAEQPGHTLPLGTRLRDYQITGLIGEGGFGIVYLAWDHSLQRRVAIKEYMPASMAARVNGSSAIVVKSERHLNTFRAGLKSFVNEARLLARFDHPSLVKVYRFWEENGTAYMAMPYYEGPTLKAALAGLGRPPSEDELRAWLTPLLDALAVMHAAQCYHRDIAPDNILLTTRGPLLLDFGAARRVIGDMTHAITVVLKPGYAPIEQYGEVASMAQGAWTDLYALASVVYFAIVGKTPTSSVERLMDDRLEPLAVSAAGRYSEPFLRAIDAALAVRPADRPQTERQFRALLDAGRPPPPAVKAAAVAIVPPSMLADTAMQARTEVRPRAAPAGAAATAAPRPPTARRSRSMRWLLAGLAVAVVVVIVGAMLQSPLRLRGAAAPAGSAASTPSAATTPAEAVPRVPGEAATTPRSRQAGGEATAPTSAEPQVTAASAAPERAAAASAAPLQAAPSDSAPGPSAPGEPAAVTTTTTARTARPPRPRRETVVPRSDASEAVARPRAAPSSTRCSDILQKASLEPLSAAETAYLKKECR